MKPSSSMTKYFGERGERARRIQTNKYMGSYSYLLETTIPDYYQLNELYPEEKEIIKCLASLQIANRDVKKSDDEDEYEKQLKDLYFTCAPNNLRSEEDKKQLIGFYNALKMQYFSNYMVMPKRRGQKPNVYLGGGNKAISEIISKSFRDNIFDYSVMFPKWTKSVGHRCNMRNVMENLDTDEFIEALDEFDQIIIDNAIIVGGGMAISQGLVRECHKYFGKP